MTIIVFLAWVIEISVRLLSYSFCNRLTVLTTPFWYNLFTVAFSTPCISGGTDIESWERNLVGWPFTEVEVISSLNSVLLAGLPAKYYT